MNLYLMLAILSSVIGPVLYSSFSANMRVSRFFDGLIIMTLLGLVLLHILPESLEHLGMGTIIAVILGLIGPVLISQLTKRKECEIQKPFLLMTILGFLAHNMLDGAALIIHPDEQHSTHLLALAVIIHRLFVSMALWRTLCKSFTKSLSSLALLGLNLAMIMGYFFADKILTNMEVGILHILQSLACGTLFHVLLHPHHIKDLLLEAKNSTRMIKIQFAGAACGLLLAVLAYLFWPEHSSIEHSSHVENHAHEHAQSQ